jgi:hypothetical protein
VSAKDVEARETEAKEVLAIQSHMSWSLDLLQVIDQQTSGQGNPESFAAPVITHIQSLNATLVDRMTTQVANSILTRRDMAFKMLDVPLSNGIEEDLRASPFLGEELFVITPAHIEEAREAKKDRHLVNALKSRPIPRFDYQPKASGSSGKQPFSQGRGAGGKSFSKGSKSPRTTFARKFSPKGRGFNKTPKRDTPKQYQRGGGGKRGRGRGGRK